ncbi:hypothetical protein DFJ69_2791 [Thermomonospora umbrina]|uniref:Uncharacterized protein n=1 Tax=Thermomonospora umbrina TaxID=111806 RepID=A0A3D9SXN7_9ACTN|nr:hypothetical protein DFJ69_2791 [Thermomonospora umbrina]
MDQAWPKTADLGITRPENAAGDPERAARDVQRSTGGRWVAWWGRSTGRYWATPRAPYPWYGLLEAATPLGLRERIGDMDAEYGHGRHGRWNALHG